MKISESWLHEWVNPLITSEALAAQLTMAGLEVDARHAVAGVFNLVVVAHVVHTTPHPDADKLTICSVDAGRDTRLQIVCGASNVRAGLKVALALPGANLPGDFVIKESLLRGQLSQGMLCSGAELGMEDGQDGIMELPDDAPIGRDLRDYLSLNDEILELDLTPNRADCFSMLGVAREVAALNQLPFTPMTIPEITPTHDDARIIHVAAPAACPLYGGRILRGINPQAMTPLWMKERLRRAGVRIVHPVVDVTNYVMLELGQPMHAFDLHAISGNILVRYAQEGESLVLLDGQNVSLYPQVLIIADDKSPLSIAGVMGGSASAVTSKTVDVFLESAFFNPITIAGVARRYGLSSDSSQRFERGVDPKLYVRALERATALLVSIVGGDAGPIVKITSDKHAPIARVISFDHTKVKRLTGLDVPLDDMLCMLTALGMSVAINSDVWEISVPSHRFDIALDVDLVEEIARLYGYDNIISSTMNGCMQAGEINPIERLSMRIATFLSDRGYNEAISYSFVDPSIQSALYPHAETMQLLNPISSELSQMRVGLWPGLLASMIHNIHRQHAYIKLFESGVVFDVKDNQLDERACIAGLLTGLHGNANWSESLKQFDFYDMKGDLQALFAVLNLKDIKFVPAEHSALHPGQSARIIINDIAVGWIGVLHPRLLDALGLNDDVMLFELSLVALVKDTPVSYQAISKYPQIRRDLSLLVDVAVSAAQIETCVREVVPVRLLKAFDVFDVYTGDSIPKGQKSLAITLTLQDDKRTLIDTEINSLVDDILKKLYDAFTIVLREITRCDV